MNKYIIHNDQSIKGFFGEYRWLSNFYPANCMYDGTKFFAVENAYQFAKLEIPKPNTEEAFKHYRTGLEVALMSAGEAKKWGSPESFEKQGLKLRPDWKKVNIDIMKALVWDKFYRSTKLRRLLLKTGKRYLEETNMWHDNFWGVCMCRKCHVITAKEESFQGENHLGLIEMKVREFWQ